MGVTFTHGLSCRRPAAASALARERRQRPAPEAGGSDGRRALARRRAGPAYIHVMSEQSAPPRVTLAELLAVLSLAADLGMGQPMEHVLRQCQIALRLADRLAVDEDEREVVYYSALVAWVGCHVDAYEQAKW